MKIKIMASIFDDPIFESQIQREEKSEEVLPKRSKHRETLSSTDIVRGRRSLASMVEAAFKTLEDAMIESDYPTAIKAAQIVLDRAGFGPKSSMDITTTSIDLSSLSREELAERALSIARQIQGKVVPKTIDVPAVH